MADSSSHAKRTRLDETMQYVSAFMTERSILHTQMSSCMQFVGMQSPRHTICFSDLSNPGFRKHLKSHIPSHVTDLTLLVNTKNPSKSIYRHVLLQHCMWCGIVTLWKRCWVNTHTCRHLRSSTPPKDRWTCCFPCNCGAIEVYKNLCVLRRPHLGFCDTFVVWTWWQSAYQDTRWTPILFPPFVCNKSCHATHETYPCR